MTTIFMAFALFFLVLAALNVPARLGLTWGWTGLAFWCLAILWPALVGYNILYLGIAVIILLLLIILLRRYP